MSTPPTGADGKKCLPLIGVKLKLSYNMKVPLYICVNFLFTPIIGEFNLLKGTTRSPDKIVN